MKLTKISKSTIALFQTQFKFTGNNVLFAKLASPKTYMMDISIEKKNKTIFCAIVHRKLRRLSVNLRYLSFVFAFIHDIFQRKWAFTWGVTLMQLLKLEIIEIKLNLMTAHVISQTKMNFSPHSYMRLQINTWQTYLEYCQRSFRFSIV